MNKADRLIRNILRDIQVELKDEFDRNFERQGFFSESWQRRKSPLRGDGHILVGRGSLRRSIKSSLKENSLVFESSLPYSEIHNEGGEIKVTARMKKFFWAKYKEATGGFRRRKDGSLRQTSRNRRLTIAADFWKAMALKKVGSVIKIPKRQFLGSSPEVEAAVREIIEENITEYFRTDFTIQ